MPLFNDREEKLIRLVLDPGAKEGEVTNGAVMLIRSLRARGVVPARLIGHQPEAEPPPRPKPTGPIHLFIFPNWGKNAGQPFDEIDPSYLRWVHNHWFAQLDHEGQIRWKWLIDEIREYLTS